MFVALQMGESYLYRKRRLTPSAMKYGTSYVSSSVRLIFQLIW